MNETVTVREVMNREYVGASESDDLLETTELLVREDEDLALVMRGNEPIGVVTPKDILGHVVSAADPESATVGDAMTEAIPSVTPETSLPEARDRMAAWESRWLLVTDDGDPQGTVTEHDILSTARLDGEGTTEPDRDHAVATPGQGAMAGERASASEDSFEEQGICSACGTFTRELASFNGQLLCTDCRDV